MRSVLVSPDALERRRGEIAGSSPTSPAPDARLRAEVGDFVARPLYVPDAKALLSRWGSLCRDDGAELAFDPSSPQAQRCTRCGRIWATEQSHRWWVYWYQLWLAERCWEAALVAALDGEPRCEARAVETLAALAARYLEYPNADNVLGPSRPFFSTYLESVWVLQLAAAASLLGRARPPPRRPGARSRRAAVPALRGADRRLRRGSLQPPGVERGGAVRAGRRAGRRAAQGRGGAGTGRKLWPPSTAGPSSRRSVVQAKNSARRGLRRLDVGDEMPRAAGDGPWRARSLTSVSYPARRCVGHRCDGSSHNSAIRRGETRRSGCLRRAG